MEFGPNDSKVMLKPRHSYVPKVLSIPSKVQVIFLSALLATDGEKVVNLLCLIRALRIYLQRSAAFRQSKQLFVLFGGRAKGKPRNRAFPEG